MVKKQMKTMRKGDELPFSLIATEILSRLPCKSDIGRCRCVCKEWNSFLSTPKFIRTHLQNHVTINDYKLLLFDTLPRKLPLNSTLPSPNPNPNPVVYFIASLDGLVCLASMEYPATLVFWNPLTGAYKKLPPLPRYDIPKVSATDPIAFYFDDSDNDYKLLCFVGNGRCGAHVYSNKLNSWREIGFSLVSPKDVCTWSPATFFGQCVYFILTYYIYSGNILDTQCFSWILCFDVKTETFRKIRVPPPAIVALNHFTSLVVLDGCLHLCVSYKIYNNNNINDVKHGGDLWRMGDGDEWVKVATFTDHPQQQRICTDTTRNWLAVLDQDDNSFKKMNTEDFITQYHHFSSASSEYRSSRLIYIETLASPNM